jgi:hypothetical protein
VPLPRATVDMSGHGESIEPGAIAPGDLIFFNTTGKPHSHVGIYVGKLRFVNAPSTGGTVRLDYLTNPYWAKRFDGIRRVATPLGKPKPFDAPSYLAAPHEAPLPAPNLPPLLAPAVAATTHSPVSPEAEGAVQIMRASTAASLPAPTSRSNDDDPIAHFANGG